MFFEQAEFDCLLGNNLLQRTSLLPQRLMRDDDAVAQVGQIRIHPELPVISTGANHLGFACRVACLGGNPRLNCASPSSIGC
jgi:hypothetical protein